MHLSLRSVTPCTEICPELEKVLKTFVSKIIQRETKKTEYFFKGKSNTIK